MKFGEALLKTKRKAANLKILLEDKFREVV